jgi:hypothetical protein
MKITLIIFLLASSFTAWCASEVTEKMAEKTSEPKVRYKAGKELDFEKLVIEGELKRPELAVVTGDNDENGNGLLRLRENFVDHMTESAGKEVQ